jgi:hypothetical protein
LEGLSNIPEGGQKSEQKVEEKWEVRDIRTLRRTKARTRENTGKKAVGPFEAFLVAFSQPVADRNVQNLLKNRQSALDEAGAFPLGWDEGSVQGQACAVSLQRMWLAGSADARWGVG